MSSPGAVPSQGFESAEEFRADPKIVLATLLAQLPLLLLLAVLCWIVGTAILGLSGAPAPSVLGILVGAVLLAVLVALRVRQLRRLTAVSRLVFDPHGIVMYEQHATTRVSWNDVHSGAMVKPLVSFKAKLGNSRVKAVGGAVVAASAVPELGLLGLGVRTLDDDTPPLIRSQYKQNERSNGQDEATGAELLPIYPAHFDLRWTRGRISEWVRHYRPDIMEQVRAHRAPSQH